MFKLNKTNESKQLDKLLKEIRLFKETVYINENFELKGRLEKFKKDGFVEISSNAFNDKGEMIINDDELIINYYSITTEGKLHLEQGGYRSQIRQNRIAKVVRLLSIFSFIIAFSSFVISIWLLLCK